MKKIVSFMHVSLDGFVAGPAGEMDWIRVDDEIFDFADARIRQADTALYGRKTWEIMQAYWPTAAEQPEATQHDKNHSAWYKQVQKVVLSKTMADADFPLTRFLGDKIGPEIKRLKKGRASGEIIMFGSATATQTLLKKGLVDEFWLFVNPVLLGVGKPFFKGIRQRTDLVLQSSHVFECGVICLHYAVVPPQNQPRD